MRNRAADSCRCGGVCITGSVNILTAQRRQRAHHTAALSTLRAPRGCLRLCCRRRLRSGVKYKSAMRMNSCTWRANAEYVYRSCSRRLARLLGWGRPTVARDRLIGCIHSNVNFWHGNTPSPPRASSTPRSALPSLPAEETRAVLCLRRRRMKQTCQRPRRRRRRRSCCCCHRRSSFRPFPGPDS